MIFIRAAAKIIQTLFVFFFKLGGVLVATSNRLPEELYSTDFRKAQFTTFFRILQSRCISYDMRSSNDYREILSSGSDDNAITSKSNKFKGLKGTHYFISELKNNEDTQWTNAIQSIIPSPEKFFVSSPDFITVYGRQVNVPWQDNGIAYFDFEQICGSPLAAADYISLASKYHTFIIDNVPALKISMKNEARRLITLLDALYECKCQLLIRAEKSCEDLFFADVRHDIESQEEASKLDQEMYSEVHQELTEPFRPNISSYVEEKPMTPIAKNNNDEGSLSSEDPSKQFFPPTPKQDFTKISAFTGEDERFAYKRAVSRLKEMTGSPSWKSFEWVPIEKESRPWEAETTFNSKNVSLSESTIKFNFERKDAPLFDARHFWSMVEWGEGKRVKDEHAKIWIRGNEIFKS